MEFKTITISSINSGSIIFNDGSMLTSAHEQDCCESHYLDFSNEDEQSLKQLKFKAYNDGGLDISIVSKIEGYGIELKPLNDHPLRIPGYGYNNGYYSTELILEYIDKNRQLVWSLDVSECQHIDD